MKSSFTSARWNNFFANDYLPLEWTSVKISISAIVCFFSIYILYYRTAQPFPSGICQYINCAYWTADAIRLPVSILLVLLSLMYIAEVQMIFSTLLLFVLAVFIFSLDESNGNPAENGILALVFFAQFVAYLQNKFNAQSNLSKNRMQFSAQFFSAAYTLSAISKLHVSGFAWFTDDAPKFALEVMRVFNSVYVTNGLNEYTDKGLSVASFIIAHPLFTKLILGGSLLLELCAFSLMLNKKTAFVYSFLLLAFHAGIFYTMNIFFPTITLPLIVFFFNPV